MGSGNEIAVVNYYFSSCNARLVGVTLTLLYKQQKNDSNVGDKVKIMATRPISKLKRWRITEVLEKAPTV